MMNARFLGAYVDLLLHLFVGSLSELPGQVVPSSVQLEVLIPLESLVAYLTYESVCCHQCLW